MPRKAHISDHDFVVVQHVQVNSAAQALYFGVLFIINNSIGLITPPVGVVLNVVAGVTRTSMEDVRKGV